MPTLPDLVLGTAGHIDHGKSSLVEALTGTDPDRLKEEKARGITIELGFAQLQLSPNVTLGVVDVPGHERFVRQMIAGSSGIDIALLCIAADDGIMPQTIEHLAVLKLLAIPQCVVALTKSDLVDKEWLEFIAQEIRSFLSDSPYAESPIVPVSSRSHEGLDNLRTALLHAAQLATNKKRGSTVRLPLDRVFTIKGAGTVVTGTLWSGSISIDDTLELLPRHTMVRVRSIQIHGTSVSVAHEGNRVALNLSNLKTSEVHPGDFLCTPQSITPTDRFDAFFTYLDTTQSGKPLKSGSRIRLAHGTKEVFGRILLMDGKEFLRPNESGYVQFRLEETLPLTWKDRYIVRSYSPIYVKGGGKVLLCHPTHRTQLTKQELSLLQALDQEDETHAIECAFHLQKKPVKASELALHFGLSLNLTAKQLALLQEKGMAVSLRIGNEEPFYLDPSLLKKYLSVLSNALMKFHAQNPALPGIAKAELKHVTGIITDDHAFSALLLQGESEGILVERKGIISHPSAGAGAQELENKTADTIASLLDAGGKRPPTIPEIIQSKGLGESLAYRALNTLEKEGRAIKVTSELYFSTPALSELETTVRNYLSTHDKATAAELKEAMDSSRKYAIPLLEHFDATGLTIRNGDFRKLR